MKTGFKNCEEKTNNNLENFEPNLNNIVSDQKDIDKLFNKKNINNRKKENQSVYYFIMLLILIFILIILMYIL